MTAASGAPTMADVAQRAGVSHQTVSRVLNNHPSIRATTKARVQQVIVDEVGPTVAKGRSKADAPQIDGAVYLSSRRPLKVGEIVTAKIERADQYDLHGSVAEGQCDPVH